MLFKRMVHFFGKSSKQKSFSYKASPRSSDDESIESLRNVDYASLRKSAIDIFNTKIKNQNVQYRSQLQKLQTIKDEDDVMYDKILREHVDRVNGITREFNSSLKQIQDLEKTNTVKLYLAESIINQNSYSRPVSPTATTGFYIPNRLVLKKLYLGSPKQAKSEEDPSKQVLLIGVQKQEQHCLFLTKLLEQFGVKQIVTMVPPDMPYFIKTEESYLYEWKKFIEDTNYARKTKFFVNPKPKLLEDICLHSRHFSVVRQSLGKSAAFIDTYYYLLKENQLDGKYDPLPLLSGLCTQQVDKMYLGDFPIFQERKMLADNMDLDTCRSLFQQFLMNFQKLRLQFSAQWLFPPEVLRKKLSHITKVTKAVAQKGEGRTVLLCPAQVAELVSIQWQLARQNPYNNSANHLYFDYDSSNSPQQTFINHIQKLVILDMIMEPIISNYFVQFRSFPFMCEHTLGGKQNIGKIFVIWTHFYNIYHQQLSARVAQDRESKLIRKSFMNRYIDPTDF